MCSITNVKLILRYSEIRMHKKSKLTAFIITLISQYNFSHGIYYSESKNDN